MMEWFKQNFDAASIAAIITALATFGSSVAAFVVAIRSKVNASRIIKEARERKTYTFCPHCKRKLYLSEMPFYLPDGAKDDNLNGVPDDQE